eukprot:TRINITY_DN3126_c0_g1_i1.p2 TRINITY_DN3126_c0_g1~~TRINITY_DN3126_c0_g1_i1.p2  ORF type:complete len:262 (+),score=47.43 TRINITY_DN3126_c0_g1_i1:116-901(+)
MYLLSCSCFWLMAISANARRGLNDLDGSMEGELFEHANYHSVDSLMEQRGSKQSEAEVAKAPRKPDSYIAAEELEKPIWDAETLTPASMGNAKDEERQKSDSTTEPLTPSNMGDADTEKLAEPESSGQTGKKRKSDAPDVGDDASKKDPKRASRFGFLRWRRSEKEPGKAPEKASEKAAGKAAEKAPEKAPEKASEKAAEKAPEKAPEKASEKAAEKAPDEAPDTPARESSRGREKSRIWRQRRVGKEVTLESLEALPLRY